MSYLRHLDRETKERVRQAKKAAAKESRAVRLSRARDALRATEAKFRQPRERDPKFLSWLRKAPCLACAISGEPQIARTEAAHVRRSYPEAGWRPVGGAERPSDNRALPLCASCHRTGRDAQHSRDSAEWYADRGIYPPEVCAQLKRAQETGADPVEIIQQVADEANREFRRRRDTNNSNTTVKP